MAKINRNNFIRWTGSFTKASYTLSTSNLFVNLYANQDYCLADISSSISASLGVDFSSFQLLSVKDLLGNVIELSQDCYYDNTTNTLQFFRPVDLTLISVVIRYSICDNSGNKVSTGLIGITISEVFTEWIAYPASSTCTLDNFGNNTGFQKWSELVLVNSSTMTEISPLTLKPNLSSDGDYIAPQTNILTCPTVGSLGYGYLFISNFTKSSLDPTNYITINNILLYSATFGIGSTPLTINKNCNIENGGTLKMYIPAGTWDNIAISYSITGNIGTATPQRFWKANLNGSISGFGPSGTGEGDNPIDDSGILSGVAITIPVTSQGITIFGQ